MLLKSLQHTGTSKLELNACGVAEFSGGIIAGLLAGPLYGVGAPWLKALIPWSRPDEEVEGTSGRLIRRHKNHSKNPAGGNQPGVSSPSESPAVLDDCICNVAAYRAVGRDGSCTCTSATALRLSWLDLQVCLHSYTRTGQVARWRPRRWARRSR